MRPTEVQQILWRMVASPLKEHRENEMKKSRKGGQGFGGEAVLFGQFQVIDDGYVREHFEKI